MSRYKNAKQCTGITKDGSFCKNHIIEGKTCWLHHTGEVEEIDPRHIIVVKCFKCPHCGKLTEI